MPSMLYRSPVCLTPVTKGKKFRPIIWSGIPWLCTGDASGDVLFAPSLPIKENSLFRALLNRYGKSWNKSPPCPTLKVPLPTWEAPRPICITWKVKMRKFAGCVNGLPAPIRPYVKTWIQTTDPYYEFTKRPVRFPASNIALLVPGPVWFVFKWYRK